MFIKFRHAMPHSCLLCNLETNHYSHQLCDSCCDDLPFPESLCLGCSLLLPNNTILCGLCQKSHPAFFIVTACYYQSPIKQLLGSLKYRKQLIVCHELAVHLARRVLILIEQGSIDKPQALLPVPLHWHRYYSRGFNQAELIAMELGTMLNIPVIRTVKRIKPTASQASLNAQERSHNLDNAFKLTHDIEYSSIAIVDDVYTTGATMHEISQTILEKNPTINIQHWAIARTIIHE